RNTRSVKKVYRHLSDKAVSFDQLCQKTGMKAGDLNACIYFMTEAKLIECSSVNQFVRVDFPLHGSTATAVNDFVAFIKGTFHGIARKYMQKYLAYWWYIKRVGQHTGTLLDQCISFGAIKQGMPTSYKTQLIVKLAC